MLRRPRKRRSVVASFSSRVISRSVAVSMLLVNAFSPSVSSAFSDSTLLLTDQSEASSPTADRSSDRVSNRSEKTMRFAGPKELCQRSECI